MTVRATSGADGHENPAAATGVRSPLTRRVEARSHGPVTATDPSPALHALDLAAVARLSAAQHGVFGRSQLLALGAAPADIRRRVRNGTWEVVLPSVYGVVGHRDTWMRRLWAAHLHAGPDSVVSHHSAGRLHGDDAAFRGRVELMVHPNRGRAPDGVTWFRRVDLDDTEVEHRPGRPPTTTAARTAIDLAGVIGTARLRRFVEASVVEQRCTLAQIGAIHARVRRSGKRGVRRLEVVLDAIGPGEAIPRTELERLGDGLIAAAGLPAPVFEHPLPNERGRSGFVDRCWPEAMLIVELDGRRWHDRSDQRRRDIDRRTEAMVLGYETVQILWEHASSDAERQSEILSTLYHRRAAWIAALTGAEPGFS